MGVPNVPLADLYSPDVWSAYPSVEIRSRANAQCLRLESDAVSGVQMADETHPGRCLCLGRTV